MTSLTRLCAPKPKAMPPMPADASAGMMLSPSVCRIMKTATRPISASSIELSIVASVRVR